ncbi:MAG: hypothetical protein LBR22_07055 [Desulfovibrio sp.]|jgi:hypothetical protein|nr:hypothetical protein [Desulfovibrio sp.]
MFNWQDVFSKDGRRWHQDGASLPDPVSLSTLPDLKAFLDAVHIRTCLVKPYQEHKNYPLVESRELLPSFDNDMFEYKTLPGFALVAFARQLNYFAEIFQYDKLYPVITDADGACCPLENQVLAYNLHTLASRLPRMHQEVFRQQFRSLDTVQLENYPTLLPYLLSMDRAHVMSWDAANNFHLSGVYASFPSDIDSELKRFGVRIGKFEFGNNEMYERNRMFVYQYLMELYGFPIVSERRTSSALFARKLHRICEPFLIRVLGQTDRTLTTYTNVSPTSPYLQLEKIALVSVDPDQTEALDIIEKEGFFLDNRRRAVIMRVTYRQHRFDRSNVRQDRALSVEGQEILHPLTGRPLMGLNIIKDSTNMFLRLNDIVRGEYTGRTLYKRTEIVENTDTPEKRLKFLYSWLSKHQRRMISYSDEFFGNVSKVLDHYLYCPEHEEPFHSLPELHKEVCSRFSYIQQARTVRILDDLCQRNVKGERITYAQMLKDIVELCTKIKFDIGNYFPALVDEIIACVDRVLRDRYIQRTYIEPSEESLTPAGQEIRKSYRRLVSLHDAFKAVRKSRTATDSAAKAKQAVS